MTEDDSERLNMLAFNALQGLGPLADVAECLRGGVVAYPVAALLADLIDPDAARDRPENRIVMIDRNGRRLNGGAASKRAEDHANLVGHWVRGKMEGWKTEAIVARAVERFGVSRATVFNHKVTVTVRPIESKSPAKD